MEISQYDALIATRAMNTMTAIIESLMIYNQGGVSAEVTLHTIDELISKGFSNGKN